jgi:hypothetical protein
MITHITPIYRGVLNVNTNRTIVHHKRRRAGDAGDERDNQRVVARRGVGDNLRGRVVDVEG